MLRSHGAFTDLSEHAGSIDEHLQKCVGQVEPKILEALLVEVKKLEVESPNLKIVEGLLNLETQVAALDSLLSAQQEQSDAKKGPSSAVFDWLTAHHEDFVNFLGLLETARETRKELEESVKSSAEDLIGKATVQEKKLKHLVVSAVQALFRKDTELLQPVAGGVASGQSWKKDLSKAAPWQDVLRRTKVLQEGDVAESLKVVFKQCYQEHLYQSVFLIQ